MYFWFIKGVSVIGYKNRELEIKMLAVGVKGLQTMVDRIEKAIVSIHKDPDVVIGNASDLYWKAPVKGLADFVRLRKNTDGAQITMKNTDKGDTIDRVEIDLEVDDYKQAKELMLALHGDPMAEVTKKYHVFFLENRDTTVSVYQVKNDDRVFVEVEARSKRRLKQLIQTIMTVSETEYEWVSTSIYTMFVEEKSMVAKPMTKFLEGV